MASPDSVDSALVAALREPRERVGLLRLEAALVDFMNADAGWLEVGGPSNSVVVGPHRNMPAPQPAGTRGPTSFQRCVLHRLADRFGIVREPGTLMLNSIRLVKLPESKIPIQLLQDLDPSMWAERTDGTAGVTEGMAQATLKPKRKMKIMKRSSANPTPQLLTPRNRTSSEDARRAADLLDKERAYAEARARIFADEESSNNHAEEGSTPSSLSAPASPWSESTATTAKDTPPIPTPDSGTAHEPSPTATTKAVYRNRAEEAADPDFRRGQRPVYPTPYAAAYNTEFSQAKALHYPGSSALHPAAPVFVPRTGQTGSHQGPTTT